MVLQIPILPHLKKFIHQRYGSGDPLRIDQDMLLGKIVVVIVKDKVKPRPVSERYSEILRVSPSWEIRERSPRSRKLAELNVHLDKIFKEKMYSWIEAQVAAGLSAYQATEDFLAHYSIKESEYSKESAYRQYLRYKHDEYEKKKARRRAQGTLTGRAIIA
jgi:hypothetical protein